MAVTAAELLVLVRAEGVEATAASLAGLGEATSAAALGFGALAIAGAATIGALGAATAEAANFQRSTMEVANNTTMATGQIDTMRQSVLALGSETGVSFDTLSQGFMKAMNITNDTATSMDILKVATESAVSTGGNAAATTNVLANAMHEYGLDVVRAADGTMNLAAVQENAAHVMGVMHLAAASGNMTLEDFSTYSGRSIGIAANLGVSLEDVSAAFSSLTRHGFDAATAGTQVTNIMTHMINPTKAAHAELVKLSNATGIDLVSDFTAAGLSSKGLEGVLGDLKGAYEKMGYSSAEAEAESMKLIAAQRGGLGLATLLGTGYEDFTKTLADLNNQELTNGITEQSYNKIRETAGFQWDSLKRTVQGAAIVLGTAMLPALTSVLAGLQSAVAGALPFINTYGPMLAAALGTGLSAVLNFWRGVTSAIGAVIEAFRSLFAGTTNLGQFIGGIEIMVGTILGKLGELAARAAPYIGAFFSAIGSAIQAYGPQVVAQFAVWGDHLSSWIQTTAIPFLLPRLANFLGTITSWVLGTAIPGMMAFWGGLGVALVGWIGNVAIPGLAANLPGWLSALGGWISGTAIPGITAFVTPLAAAFSNWVTTTALPATLAQLSTWGTEINAWLNGTFAPAVAAAMAAAWAVVSTATGEAFSALGTIVRAKATDIKNAVGEAFSELGTAVRDKLTEVKNAVGDTFSGMGTAVRDALTSVKNAVGDTFSGMGTAVRDELTAVKNAVGDTFSGLGSTVQGALDAVRGIILAVWNAIPADIRQSLDQIAANIGERFSAFGSTVQAAMAVIESVVVSGWVTITAAVGAAMSAVGSAVDTGWAAITAAVGAAMSAVGTVVSTGWSAVSTAVGAAMSVIGANIESGWTAAVAIVTAGAAAIYGAITSAWDVVSTSTQSAWSAFATAISTFIGQAVARVVAFGGEVASALASVAGSAAAEAAAIGSAIIEGIGGALQAGAGALATIAGNVVRGALDAAKGALGIQSPSREFAYVGQMSVQGMIDGFVALAGQAADAARGVAVGAEAAVVEFMEIASPSKRMHRHGQNVAQGLANGIHAHAPAVHAAGHHTGTQAAHGMVAGVKDGTAAAAKAAADLAVAVSKGITDTLAALHLLSTYDFSTGSPSGSQFAMLGTLTAQMVATIQDAAKGFSEAGLKAATLFAEAAGKVGTMVKNALTGLKDLAEFDFAKNTPTAQQMGMLTTLTVSLVQTIQDAAAQFNDLGLKSATLFAEAANKVGGMVKHALEGISELAAFDFAKNTPTAQQMGMLTTLVVSLVQTIQEASVAFSAEGVKHAQVFAESADKIGKMIKPALTGLADLANFDFTKNTPTGSAMGLFRQLVTDVVLNIQEAATAFTDAGIKAASSFSDAATKVMSLIATGVTAFEKLSSFVAPPAAAIYAFGKALRAAMNDLALVAEQVTLEAATSAAKFSAEASHVVTLLGSGVTAFEKLANFHGVATDAIYAFGKALRAAINDFALLSEQITPDATRAAAVFAEGAGKVVGIIGSGVDGFTKLADFTAPASSAIYAFGKTLRSVIDDLALVAEQVTQQATDSAAKFSEGAGKVLGIFGNGITGLMELSKFVAPSQKAIDDFAYAVGHLVERFANAARMIGEDGVAEAGKFGQAAHLAVQTIATGIKAFDAFKTMHLPTTEAVDALVGAVGYVVAKFRDMADQMGGEALRKAQTFSTAVENVAKSLQTAIGTFKSLTEKPFKGAMTAIMTEFNGDFDGALKMMLDAVTKAAEFETQAHLYKESMLRAASDIAAGNAALANAALPGNSIGKDMAAAGKNMGNSLAQGARDSLEIKSPSQVMATVGQQVVQGLIQGMSAMTPAAVAAAADAATKVAQAISATFDALSKIGNFRETNLSGLYALGKALRAAVNDFAMIAEQVTPQITAAAALFAEGAGKVAATIGTAVTAFAGLAHYVDAPASAIYAFGKTIRLIVNDLALVAEQVTVEAAAHAGLFAEGVGKIVAILGNAVTGIAALGNYRDVGQATIDAFVRTVGQLVRGIESAAKGLAGDGLTLAGQFAEAAGKIVGILGNGVTGIAALNGYRAAAPATIDAFVETVNYLVRRVAVAVRGLTTEGLTLAGQFADAGGKIVGILGNGVTGFAALSNYRDVARGTIDAFVATVAYLVRGVESATRGLTADGLTLAGQFADAGGKIVGMMGNAVGGLASLNTFVEPLPFVMDRFMATVHTVIVRFAAMAATMNTEGIAATGAFGDAASKALGAVKVGIDAFSILDRTNMPTPAKLDDLVNAIRGAVQRVAIVSEQVGTKAIADAASFGAAASTIFTALKSGLDLFILIDKPGNWPKTDWLQPLVELMGGMLTRGSVLLTQAQQLGRIAQQFADAMASLGGSFKVGDALAAVSGNIQQSTAQLAAATPASPTMAAPTGPRGGTTIIVNVDYHGNTVLGQDYAATAQLAQALAPELRRLVGV